MSPAALVIMRERHTNIARGRWGASVIVTGSIFQEIKQILRAVIDSSVVVATQIYTLRDPYVKKHGCKRFRS